MADFKLWYWIMLCITLSCCANNFCSSEKHLSFIKEYSDLECAESASGSTLLRWIVSEFSIDQYDGVYYNVLVSYPEPIASTQTGQDMWHKLLIHSSIKAKDEISSVRVLALLTLNM